MHYDNLLVVGTDQLDLSAAYQPVRTQLKEHGGHVGAGRSRSHGPDALPAGALHAGQTA